MSKLVKFLFFLITFELPFNKINTLGKDIDRNTKELDCQTCKIFTESFHHGMKSTEKDSYAGGDTAWEEEKLGSYATSELRLIEIQEKVCSEVTKDKDLCYIMHGKHDNEIEEWWFNSQLNQPDLYKHFCIEKWKYCCPDFHYGPPKCLPCPGFPNVCSNNGICKKNGKCSCDKGYIGQNCDACAKKYFKSHKNKTEILCKPCPNGCDICTEFNCTKCSKGWLKSNDSQCLDINECLNELTKCKMQEFCVNTDGSYNCLPCDVACDGCIGYGPDMCRNCSEGYKLINNMCMLTMRYDFLYASMIFLYLGMFATTSVIYQKNRMLALFIVIIFMFYIKLIENVLNKL